MQTDAAAEWPAAATRQWEWLLSATVLLVAAIVAFSPVMMVLVGQWSTNDTYSFGVLVPLISGYFVWVQRDRLRQLPVAPSPWVGSLLIAGCAALLTIGRVVGVIGLQEIAMVLMVPACVWFLCGRRYVLALWFPLFYLLLMLPIWEILTDRFHYRFQLFSARLGEGLLSTAGIPVHRSETFLELPHITLEVASVCSGVNFLIAVLAIGVPQAYLFLRGWMPRAVVMGFAVAIAMFSNGLRIAIIGVLSHYELTKQIHGPGHLLQGLFVSAAGLIALQAAIGFMARRFPKNHAGVSHPRRAIKTAPSRRPLLMVVSATALMLVAAASLEPRELMASAISRVQNATLRRIAEGSQSSEGLRPMEFVQGGPELNLGRTFLTAGGRKVDLYAGDLTYAEPTGGLGYRRVILPTRAAVSEMPVDTGGRTILVNSVSFRSGDQDTDVAYWYDVDGAVTSQVTTAKLGALWSLVASTRPLPLLVLITRTRPANSGPGLEPIEHVIADVFRSLQPGPAVQSPS